MAHITLAGTLLDPTSELAVGDQVRFTHKSTTGETIKSAVSLLTIPPTGDYSIDLQYGLVLVEYKDVRKSQFKNLGVATVNQDNPATSIPELLNALVPVSSAELIEFQAILADCVAAQAAAELAATNAAASAASIDSRVVDFTVLNDAITSADPILLFDGSSLNVEEYTLGGGGGAMWDVVLSASVTTNAVNIVQCTGIPTLALVRRETANITPKISFIFDDAHESVKGVLKTLFDARGYKFGMAIPGASLTNLSSIDYNDMLDMTSDGYEVINHAFTGDAPSTTTYGKMKFKGEVLTAQTRFNRSGINTVGFVTPNSKLNDVYKDSLSEMMSYGFTEFATTEPIPRGTSPYSLHRFNMEAETEQENIDAVDKVGAFGGTIVFYAHDVVLNDAQYDKIVAIMDRAEELGIVDIVGVTESIKNITELKDPILKYRKDNLINNDPNIYSSADASIIVNNVSDLNITITPASLIRVEATIDLPDNVIEGELLTFCSTLRTISGVFGDASAIGIELKDVGDVIEVSNEISGVELNTNVARYNISAITLSSTAKATVYMMIDCAQAGSVALMRNPLLRYGNDVEAEKYIAPQDIIGITSVSIPTQPITAGALQTVTLNSTPDNGRFSIASNKLTITSDWTGSIHGTITGGTQASDGGYVAWTIGGTTANGGAGGTACISPITDAEQPLGCASIAASFKVGQTLTLRCFPRIQNISVTSSTSRITSM